MHPSGTSMAGNYLFSKGKWGRAAALSLTYTIVACLLVPTSASAQDTAIPFGIAEEVDFATYPTPDIASSTVRICLYALSGEANLHGTLSELGWREVARLDLQERHIQALATFQFNESIDYNVAPEQLWKSGWDRAMVKATQQAQLPSVRNFPRQTMWFDREASNAFLQIEMDNDEVSPSIDCDLAVTADIGASSVAARFQSLPVQDIPPVISVPFLWSRNGGTNQAVYLTFFDANALQSLTSDGFDFIGHMSVKLFISTRVQQ